MHDLLLQRVRAKTNQKFLPPYFKLGLEYFEFSASGASTSKITNIALLNAHPSKQSLANIFWQIWVNFKLNLGKIKILHPQNIRSPTVMHRCDRKRQTSLTLGSLV